MQFPLVLLDRETPGLAVVTLNRPQAMNALSAALLAELTAAIEALTADRGVRVLLLTGAGRAFCAGLDLGEIGAGRITLDGTPARASASDPVAALDRFRGPVIGAINDPAVTGGFELALACDMLLASPEARFADTHVHVGVMPGWGLSQRLSRVIGPYRAREASLTGNWIGAEQAAAWGLVNRVVAADSLIAEARQLAADLLAAEPQMLLRYKAVIRDGYAQPFGAALELERARSREFNACIDTGAVAARRVAVRARNRAR